MSESLHPRCPKCNRFGSKNLGDYCKQCYEAPEVIMDNTVYCVQCGLKPAVGKDPKNNLPYCEFHLDKRIGASRPIVRDEFKPDFGFGTNPLPGMTGIQPLDEQVEEYKEAKILTKNFGILEK